MALRTKRSGQRSITLPKAQPVTAVVSNAKVVTLRAHRMDAARLASVREWLKAQSVKGREAIKAGVDPVKIVEYLKRNHP